MKYFIDYQFLAAGASRPSDDGQVVGIEATDESGLVVIPNVGDFVDIQNPHMDKCYTFSGKVKSRLFRYIRAADDEVFCSVNIVIEEDNETDWGLLIKE